MGDLTNSLGKKMEHLGPGEKPAETPEDQEIKNTKIEFEIPEEIPLYSALALGNLYGVYEHRGDIAEIQRFLREELQTMLDEEQAECDNEKRKPDEAKQYLESQIIPHSESSAREIVQGWIDKAKTLEAREDLQEMYNWLFNVAQPEDSIEEQGEADGMDMHEEDSSTQTNPIAEVETGESGAEAAGRVSEPDEEKIPAAKQEKFSLTVIPYNSRLYHEYAPKYMASKKLQKGFATVEDYLQACYADLTRKDGRRGNGAFDWPEGCSSEEDLLKPFWKTQFVTVRATENGHEHSAKVFASSWFALEHGVQYVAPRPVTLAHHVYESRNRKKESSSEDLQSVEPQDTHANFGEYLNTQAGKAMADKAQYPEIAVDKAVMAVGVEDKDKLWQEVEQEAFAARTEEEIRQWFQDKRQEFIELEGNKEVGLARYVAAGYDKLEKYYFFENSEKTYLPNHPAEVGSPEDYAAHKERWESQKAGEDDRQNYSADKEEFLRRQTEFSQKKIDPNMAAAFYADSGIQNGIEMFEGERAYVKNPSFKAFERNRQLTMEFDSDTLVNNTVKTRSGMKVTVNLPKEIAFDAGEMDKYTAALRRSVENNEGSSECVVFSRDNKICFGLGNRKDGKLEAVYDLSEQQLKDLFPGQESRIGQYWDKKSDNKFLQPDEFKEMLETEKIIRNCVVDMGDGEPAASIGQKVWDAAFKSELIKELGLDEFKRLEAEYEKQAKNASGVKPDQGTKITVVRHDSGGSGKKSSDFKPPLRPASPDYYTKRRFVMDPEVLNSPEFEAKKAKYFEKIKRSYASWEDFLKRSHDVREVGKYAGFEKPGDSYYVLGEAILNLSEREPEYEEFNDLMVTPSHELARYLESHPDIHAHKGAGDKDTKAHYLRTILLKTVREKPLPSDVWRQGTARQEASSEPRVSFPERKNVLPEIQEVEITTPKQPNISSGLKAEMDKQFLAELDILTQD